MRKGIRLLPAITSLILLSPITGTGKAPDGLPNVVFILADDLGYGDVHALNPEGCRLATPNLDRLAAQGMVFTDAHSTSSVCSPTRYSLLTGRYNWRSRLQEKIVFHGEPPLIPPSRMTVAKLFQQHGYATAAIGKWHLGLEWSRDGDGLNYSEPFAGGPTELGFDWYFGVDTPGYPPYGYIENDRLIGDPSQASTEEMVRWGGTPGLMVPGFTNESMLPMLTEKACEFVERNAAEGTPFFLYYAMSAPHTPLAPNEEWVGSSGLGRYADFVQELDYEVGRLIEAIDRAGVGENTLVFFTSDNGCTPMVGTLTESDLEDGLPKELVPAQEELFDKPFQKLLTTGRVLELEAEGHDPSAGWRGYKSDIWDGGHRVPFIVRWPARVEAGTQSDELVSLMDLMATSADLLGVTLPADAGEDSISLLPVLEDPDQSVRESLVHHSFYGKFAIRDGDWKLILSPGSGGWWPPRDGDARERGLPEVQLYDMKKDPGEQVNLQPEYPGIVERLTRLLEETVANGRSTPGPTQSNDVSVDIWKKES